MFVLADEENGHRYARMVEHKGLGEGGDNHWLVLDAAKEIRSWGHTEGDPIILKCDGEGAIRNVRDALGRYLGHTTPRKLERQEVDATSSPQIPQASSGSGLSQEERKRGHEEQEEVERAAKKSNSGLVGGDPAHHPVVGSAEDLSGSKTGQKQHSSDLCQIHEEAMQSCHLLPSSATYIR